MTRSGGVALAVVVAATAAAIAFQPLATPWWVYADGDATYAASGIELMGGDHTDYLDHPGMPILDVMAITTDVRYAVHRVVNGPTKRLDYVNARLLNLDDSRVYFRGWAIAFFIFGALLTFGILSRLFEGPWWGAAGALLWLAAPQIDSYSMRFLPDALQAGLVLGCGYLIVRAAQARSAWTYVLAVLLLGLSITVKLHAAGLFLPLAVALVWRPPTPTWRQDVATDARRWLHHYRIPLSVFAIVWIAFCIVFDPSRVPFTLTSEQHTTLVRLSAALLVYIVVVLLFATRPLRRFQPGILRPFGLLLVGALAVGVLLPATLFVNDLPEMLVKIVSGLTGSGVNEGVTPFTLSWHSLLEGPLVYTVVLFAIAAVAAAVGVARRDPIPVLWFAGATATGGMALARLGTPHYFQPAYVLSIPAALWLAHSLPRRLAVAAAGVLVLVMVTPAAVHIRTAARYAQLQELQGRATQRLVAGLVTRPGTIAISDDYAPAPDVRWYELVGEYLAVVPAYPYRVVPVTAAPNQLEEHRLLPIYYIGGRGLQSGETLTTSFGSYSVAPMQGGGSGIGAARLTSGPGVDRPFGHEDARYDPWTGYYRDSGGAYWDLFGSAVSRPVRRVYLPGRKLWVDAAGDYWTATGKHAGHEPVPKP